MKLKPLLHFFFLLIGIIVIHGHTCAHELSTGSRLKHAESLLYSHPDSTELILNDVVEEAIAGNDRLTAMQAYRLLGILSDIKGEYSEAVEWYNQAEQTAVEVGDSLMLGRILLVKGIIAHRLFDYEKALSFYLDAKNLIKRLGNSNQLAAVLNNIAVVYREMSQDDEAKGIYSEVITLALEGNDSLRLAPAYLNLAAILVKTGNIDSAEALTLKSLEIRNKSNDKYHLPPCYQTLASIYLHRENYETAMAYAKTALAGFKEMGGQEKLPPIYSTKALLHLRLGDMDSALIYSDSAITICQRLADHPGKSRAFAIRAQILEASGDLKGAIAVYREVVDILEASYSYGMQSKMLAFQIDQRTDGYKKDLLLTQQKQSEMEAREKVSRLFILSLILVLVFTIIILVILFRANASRNKFLDHVSLQNEQYKELINVQGNTLSVVGHDLRSPIASLLNLFRLIRKKQLNPAELQDVIMHGETSLENTLLNIDGLIEWAGSKETLNTSTQVKVNVKRAAEQVKELYLLMARAKEIHVQLEGDPNIEAFMYEGDLELILRNLLNNSLKFSPHEADISIRFSFHPHGVQLEVEDSGAGMTNLELEAIRARNPKSTQGTEGEAGTGMGVAILFDTVERNNGSIEYSSTKGIGTKVSIVLPAKPAAKNN